MVVREKTITKIITIISTLNKRAEKLEREGRDGKQKQNTMEKKRINEDNIIKINS